MGKLDNRAKASLCKWPNRSRSLWGSPEDGGWWLRAQPILKEKGAAVGPRLIAPGTPAFKTQPDGLWVYLVPDSGYADAIAVEACGSVSNLRDKRSRYSVLGTSMLVTCTLTWLREQIQVQKGRHVRRWKAAETFPTEPNAAIALPVRAIRVLFALPEPIFKQWRKYGMGAAHEYYCPIQSLEQHNAQRMQRLLKRMAPDAHYLR